MPMWGEREVRRLGITEDGGGDEGWGEWMWFGGVDVGWGGVSWGR